MSNELAGKLPDYLQKYVHTDKPNREQFGYLDRSDLSLNFVQIVHPNSLHTQPGWGATGQEAAIPVKTMVLNRSGRVISVETPFVPLYRHVQYIQWQGKPGSKDAKIVFLTDNRNDKRITDIDGLSFGRDEKDNAISPKVTTYINIYIMIKGEELPCILSYKRTGMPEGRRFTQDMLLATKGGVLDIFALMYKFGPVKEVRDGTLLWYLPTVKAAGFTPAEIIDKASKMAEISKNLSTMAGSTEFEASESTDPGALKKAPDAAVPGGSEPPPTGGAPVAESVEPSEITNLW